MVSWTDSEQFKNRQFKNRQSEPRLSDLVDMFEFKKNKPVTIRLLGSVNRVAIHWIEITKKAGGKTRIPRVCLAYDSDKNEYNGKCPYCTSLGNRPRIQVLSNGIDRDAQENQPRRLPKPSKSESREVEHFGDTVFLKTDKDSPTWTPVRLASFTSSVALKISDRTETNRRKSKDGKKKKYGPEHPKFGFDIIIKYDPDREPANQYSVIRGDNTELTEEELAYHRWRLDLEKPKTLAEATLDAKGLLKILADKPEEDSDDESPKKGKKGKKPAEEFDEDDFDDDDEDEKPKSKKSKKSRDDDDDDDDDEPPRKKSKASKKSRYDDDDEDEDEDEDDEPPRKKPKGKKKPVDDDEDDEEEDEDEKPRKGKASRSRNRDDEDDDEDDEPRKPRSKSASASKAKSSKKSRDEDEDEDDDDDWGDDD